MKFGQWLKKTFKKIGKAIKKIFTSKEFKKSVKFVGEAVTELNPVELKELTKIVTDFVIKAENTKLTGLQKTRYVIDWVLKVVADHDMLKNAGVEIQNIVYLIGVLVPQLFPKK